MFRLIVVWVFVYTEDHAKGLSTFTIMAGLGGFMGYSLGGINWDTTAIGICHMNITHTFEKKKIFPLLLHNWCVGAALGGHVRAVFTIVTFIFIFCVFATVTSFEEVPLWILDSGNQCTNQGEEEEIVGSSDKKATYGATAVSAILKSIILYIPILSFYSSI